MDWHGRFVQQAAWTRELRAYLFAKAGLSSARRVLEVGCGTGAVLSNLDGAAERGSQLVPRLHGLDINRQALSQCSRHVPGARLTCGNALALPYSAATFDITCCHFLLLWIEDPLQVLREMKRVTVESGSILALAEPDYTARQDSPAELAELGRLQNEALRAQGAALARGAELGEFFRRAGIRIIETGALQPPPQSAPTPESWSSEWAVLEHDLATVLSATDLARWKEMDRMAALNSKRVLQVPTYYAYGQV